ncbi:hypothetical protein L1887_14798 [Cichorium endivia]|nr:hypothetical protein L1887_14798 [Cichorium endivia]
MVQGGLVSGVNGSAPVDAGREGPILEDGMVEDVGSSDDDASDDEDSMVAENDLKQDAIHVTVEGELEITADRVKDVTVSNATVVANVTSDIGKAYTTAMHAEAAHVKEAHSSLNSQVVRPSWDPDTPGYQMYKVFKNLKTLKKPLGKLLRSQGNLFSKVISLRIELDRVQIALDRDPFNRDLRDEQRRLVMAALLLLGSIAGILLVPSLSPQRMLATPPILEGLPYESAFS